MVGQNKRSHAFFLAALLCASGLSISWAQPTPTPILVKATESTGKTILGEIKSENDTSLDLLDLKTGKKLTLQKSALNDLRKGVSDREAGITIGVPNFLVWKIRKYIPTGSLTGKIAAIEASTLYVNVGSKDGAEEGQEFLIYRGETAVKDPDTHEVLGSQKRRIARLTVTEAQEKLSKCKLLGDLDVEVKIGDTVERFAPNKPIAVLPFVDPNGEVRSGSKKLAEDITTGLSQGGISLVERTLLDKVLLELGLQNTLLFDPANAQKIGKQVGAFAVLSGTVAFNSEVNIRLVKVETGEILFATSQNGPPLGSIAGTPPQSVQTTVPSPTDLFPVGSFWRGQLDFHCDGSDSTFPVTLLVLDRSPGTFRGHEEILGQGSSHQVRDISGTVVGNKISWLARNAKVSIGGAGWDCSGALTASKLVATGSGFIQSPGPKQGHPSSGTYTLYLQANQ